MAPRGSRNRRQAVPPQDEPTAPRARTQRSRTRVKPETKTSTLQDEEQFNLDAISGSEDDHEPLQGDHDYDADSPAQGENSGDHVNDPDAAPMPKVIARDILYFYDKSGDKVVCRICRQVSYVLRFLNWQLTTQSLGQPRKRTRLSGHQSSVMSMRIPHRLHLSVLTSKDTTSIST
jgi:hypothetical protein